MPGDAPAPNEIAVVGRPIASHFHPVFLTIPFEGPQVVGNVLQLIEKPVVTREVMWMDGGTLLVQVIGCCAEQSGDITDFEPVQVGVTG